MPKSKSVQKAARSAEKKRMRNRSVKTSIKTHMTKAEGLIVSNQLESAQPAVEASISVLDKAAKKGVIHPNAAARRKSRLMRKFNKAVAAGSIEATNS